MTVTIAGKEYPWPEGCKYFRDHGEGRKVFDPDIDDQIEFGPGWVFQYINELDCPAAKPLVPIIAAVAVMHFENTAERFWTKAIAEGGLNTDLKLQSEIAEQAACAWRELCKEI